MSTRQRLFFALAPDPAACATLNSVVVGLRREAARAGLSARWVRPEKMHVTLRFLGEQPVERVPTLHAALRGACAGRAPFTLHLSELGTFGPARHARVVFSGLRGALEELAGLVGDLLEPILCTQSVPAESVRVERIGLYQSVFGPQGTEYHSMFDVELTS